MQITKICDSGSDPCQPVLYLCLYLLEKSTLSLGIKSLSWILSEFTTTIRSRKNKKKKTKSHQLSSWSRLSVAGRPRTGIIQGPGCQPCLYRLTVPPLVSVAYSVKQMNYLLTKTTLKLSIEDIIQNSITILKMCPVIFLLMVLLLLLF